jgi:F-type H+-transporting ATPase subunit epsilon
MLKVSVVTPASRAFEGECASVTVPGALGQLQILPSHDALLTATTAGLLILQTASGSERFLVGAGFVEVANDVVSVLTNSIQGTEDIDKAAASVVLKEQEALLTKVCLDTVEADAIQKRIDMARAHLQA